MLVISQGGNQMPVAVQQKLNRAWKAYLDAQALSLRASYDETKEEKLNTEALQGFKDILPDLQQSPHINDSLLFQVQFAIGELEHFFGNYDAALYQYQSLFGLHSNRKLTDTLLFKPLLYAGLIHYQRGQVDSATYVFLKADAIQQQYRYPLAESQRLYNTLGVLSYDAGNYRQARNYFQKALERINRNDPAFLDLESNYLINIAQAEMKLGAYDDALANYQQLIHLGRNLNEIYHNMAMVLNNKGRFGEALDYLRKVSFGKEKQQKLLNSFAKTYFLLNDTLRCRQSLEQAMAITGNGNPNDIGASYKILGDLEMSKANPEKALQAYTKAIGYYYPGFRANSEKDLPQQYSGIFSYIDLYETLVAKAKAWHSIGDPKEEGKKEALKTYISAYALLDHVIATYESDEARMFINRSRYSSHDEPIGIAFDLYQSTGDTSYLHKLYLLDQQNKASVLAFNVIRGEAMRNDSAELQAMEIRKQITRLSNKTFSVTDSLLLETTNARIRDLELQLSSFRNRKIGLSSSWQKVPAIGQLQQELLDHHAALVSYHLSDQALTITVITANKVQVSRKKLPLHFREDIGTYINTIKNPGQVIAESQVQSLYHLLLDEVVAMKPSRLIVVPDNELNYLPLETLKDEQGNFVLNQFSVLYQYSTAFLQTAGQSKASQQSIAFAPFAHSAADSFPVLPASGDEINAPDSRIYVDTAATRQAFISHAGQAGILHLATHASASSQPGASYLVFRNSDGGAELLLENEIYTMNLKNTRMVILSACETASGSLMEGEGIMSLSRAFTYAGVDDIITTHWKADDKTTSYLVKKVKAYILDGAPYDEALRKAKLDLLNDPQLNPRLKHPYYWSHLVLIGNFQPHKGNRWPWLVLVVLLVAGAGGYFYRKRTATTGT